MAQYKMKKDTDSIKILSKNEDIGISEDILISIDNKEDIEKIDTALKEGLSVRIKDNEIIIGDTDYFHGVPLDNAEKVKEMAELHRYINSRIQPHDIVDFITYMEIAFELADNGYFITDQNKEEKYLEILETGDEHLIDLLEDFLNMKDKINKIKFIKAEFDKKVESILEN